MWQVHKNPLKKPWGNFSDTLFNFEKFARNVAGYGNFEKVQVPRNVAGSRTF